MRAVALGGALACTITGVALAAGLAPAGQGWCLVLGTGLAVAAGMLATVFHVRLLRRAQGPGSVSSRPAGTQLQAGLALGFASKLLGLLLGAGVLLAAGAKFTAIAAFAVTFAVASLVLQLCTAATFARAIARRRAAAGPVRGTDPT